MSWRVLLPPFPIEPISPLLSLFSFRGSRIHQCSFKIVLQECIEGLAKNMLDYRFSSFGLGLSGMKSIEIEFTQCLVFFPVKPSPMKTWPKCAPHLAHWISVRTPSESGRRFTAPEISSSKLGQPQSASNLLSER